MAIGDELFLFERVSIGRPLDYEIGQPATISERNRRLEKKVSQALSLAEFFRDNAVGTNFEFRQIRRFVPFVVSPFEEWIWDGSERMWEQDPHQRVGAGHDRSPSGNTTRRLLRDAEPFDVGRLRDSVLQR